MTKNSKPRASEEAREVDAFIRYSEALLKWLQDNIMAVLAVVGIAAVSAVGIVVFQQVRANQEMAAQEAYSQIEKTYLDLKEKYDKASDEKESKETASGDIEQDYGEVLKRLKVFLQDHEGTSAAYLAAILKARLQFDHQLYPAAEKVLRKALSHSTSSSLLSGLANDMMGTLVEAQERCQEAVTYWDQVLTNKAMNYLHSQVLLKKALCLENMSKTGEAREVYQRIDSEFADSPAAQRAKTYLRLLDIKKGS